MVQTRRNVFNICRMPSVLYSIQNSADFQQHFRKTLKTQYLCNYIIAFVISRIKHIWPSPAPALKAAAAAAAFFIAQNTGKPSAHSSVGRGLVLSFAELYSILFSYCFTEPHQYRCRLTPFCSALRIKLIAVSA